MRFRKALAVRGLAEPVFDAITAQLRDRHVTVKRGTIMDATIIASASKSDDEARWVKHKNKKAVMVTRLMWHPMQRLIWSRRLSSRQPT